MSPARAPPLRGPLNVRQIPKREGVADGSRGGSAERRMAANLRSGEGHCQRERLLSELEQK